MIKHLKDALHRKIIIVILLSISGIKHTLEKQKILTITTKTTNVYIVKVP
jgi:hypothetical protein